ncbi:MAG: cation:proton antiporter, partial [Candidatus Spechtbacterales bacterium]|nr:cation:proton antiporter [Candidatus Spechtbacterales bacterium]
LVAGAKKINQSPVLAQLGSGILLATVLIFLERNYAIHLYSDIMENPYIEGFAEFGVVILLLHIGMHSTVGEMLKVGGKATAVALVGVILPILGLLALALPFNIGGGDWTVILFFGAAMTATSVALSVSVLKELGLASSKEGKTVQGAAVIDDILGLVLLALVAGMATSGSIDTTSLLLLLAKAGAFVGLALAFGGKFADWVSKVVAKFVDDIAGEISLVVLLALFLAGVAFALGLEPIIGAFAAGLILEEVHLERFKNSSLVSVEWVVDKLMVFFVPLFFVRVGMLVDITVLTPTVLAIGGAVSLVAILTKYVAGFAAPGLDSKIIGWSMVPRGEVGLVFASIGAGLGVFSAQDVAIIITMVIVTTFAAPILLKRVAQKAEKKVPSSSNTETS